MKTQAEASVLADYMIQICRRLGVKAGVFLTKHDNPLGFCIGNQLEIEETIECLHGQLTEDIDLVDLTVKFGGYLLHKTRMATTMFEGSRMILEKLRNGEALEKFRQMLVCQGVNEHIANELCLKKNYVLAFGGCRPKHVTSLRASVDGFIKAIDALELGVLANKLGAGRSKAGEAISYEVGFRLTKKLGERVEKSKI